MKTLEITCKKCEAKLAIQVDPWPESDRICVKVTDATIVELPSSVEVRCKSCGGVVALVGVSFPLG